MLTREQKQKAITARFNTEPAVFAMHKSERAEFIKGVNSASDNILAELYAIVLADNAQDERDAIRRKYVVYAP